MATVFKQLPGVLSFQRGLVVTDGTFWSVMSDNKLKPVPVMRHGIRGTQNVNKTSVREISNIQTTDTAKIDPEAVGLCVQFSIRFLALEDTLFACARSKGAKDAVNLDEYRQSVDDFIDRAKDSEGLVEVSRRFARNIGNGRWLWRNRTIARAITVEVWDQQIREGNPMVRLNAFEHKLNAFDGYSEGEVKVGECIAEGLRDGSGAGLYVDARLNFGVQGAIEVFPSQNYVENKPKGFARPLYCTGDAGTYRADRSSGMAFDSHRVMGQAALRDQKISNALRTIDTWYPSFAEHGQAIAVEPMGANLEAQAFFRDAKTSAFEYAKRLNNLDPDSPEGMFMIASLVRGGVYSGSET